jgi:hypothetical protein
MQGLNDLMRLAAKKRAIENPAAKAIAELGS